MPVTALDVSSIASYVEYSSDRLSTFPPYLDRLVATLLAPSGGRTGIREPGTPERPGVSAVARQPVSVKECAPPLRVSRSAPSRGPVSRCVPRARQWVQTPQY